MVGVTYSSFATIDSQWNAEEMTAERLVPGASQANMAEFGFSDAQTVTLTSAATPAGSGVSLPLEEPLEYRIPNASVLDFGGGVVFTLTKEALRGQKALTGNLAADTLGDETYESPGISGVRAVPDGILVGRTFAERDAGGGYGPADLAGDDEIFIVAMPNESLNRNAGITLLRHRHMIYEDKLPGWSDLDAAGRAKVRELYDCLSSPVAE